MDITGLLSLDLLLRLWQAPPQIQPAVSLWNTDCTHDQCDKATARVLTALRQLLSRKYNLKHHLGVRKFFH